MQVDSKCIHNDDTRTPKLVYGYIATGRRNVDRPRRRWMGTYKDGKNLDSL